MNPELFESVVKAFQTTRDKDGNTLKMDSIIISQGHQTLSHYFTPGRGMNDLRSLSKPVLGMAVGIAMEEGFTLRGERLTLATAIWPFFREHVQLSNERNIPKLERVTLHHLLNHTIGFDVGLMFSKDIKERNPANLLEYILNTDITHEPGEHFVYSNAGPYLLSALIQEETGTGLAEWVRQRLFQPLGIADFEWNSYGRYCAASSGLRMSNRDLHRLARLFLDGGQFSGRQIVPRTWIDTMKRPQVETPTMYDEKRVFPKFGYSFGLWICRDGNYYTDGTDGQYMICLPRTGVLVTTFGHQPDMKPITECLRPLK